ncbi:protein of unknown function [Methylorubrum extorquens]|uniref:Uncharacterized protein n=1 Tax=Methylorubrum extorquens TaxID=408 RepID=A0A2N9ARJ4_METEX|nr:protein of unknown function [Methylorubrum extorquens]
MEYRKSFRFSEKLAIHTSASSRFPSDQARRGKKVRRTTV